jgi:hypothetical protein
MATEKKGRQAARCRLAVAIVYVQAFFVDESLTVSGLSIAVSLC